MATKRKRWTGEQKRDIVKAIDDRGDMTLQNAFKRYGIAPPQYYNWKKKYGGSLTVAHSAPAARGSVNTALPNLDRMRHQREQNLARIKGLEDENALLQKLIAVMEGKPKS